MERSYVLARWTATICHTLSSRKRQASYLTKRVAPVESVGPYLGSKSSRSVGGVASFNGALGRRYQRQRSSCKQGLVSVCRYTMTQVTGNPVSWDGSDRGRPVHSPALGAPVLKAIPN